MSTTKEMIETLEGFFTDDALIQPAIVPKRLDIKNGRWYEYDGVYKPSLTTILNVIHKGIGFDMWLGNATSFKDAMNYANERADIGSRIHTDIAHMILGKDVEIFDREEEEIKRLFGFRQFWQHYTPQPITVECPLFSPNYNWAGTADLVAKVNYKGKDENWLIDWKTGNIYETVKYQLSGYKYIIEEGFGINIDRLAVVQLKEYSGSDMPTAQDKPKYGLKFCEPISKEFMNFIYELWTIENKNPKPKFPAVYPPIITLTEENEDDKGVE